MAEPLHELVPAAVVQVGSSSAALQTREVRSLAILNAVFRVPLAPEELAGIAVVLGEPLPVVDLGVVLVGGLPRARGGETAIICRGAAGSVALIGGKIRWVGRLRRSPHKVVSPLAEWGVEWRGATVPVVNLDTVFDSLRGVRVGDEEAR